MKPGSPGQVGQVALARVTEVWNRRTFDKIGGQFFHFHQHTGRLAVQRAADELDLHIGPLPALNVPPRSRRPWSARRAPVVVDSIVVGRVEDVGVQAVFVRAKVEHAQAHLHGRAVGMRGIASSPRHGGGAGEGRLSGKAGRVIKLQAEGGHEGGVVGGADVVGGHATAGEEAAVVDGRAVDRAAAPAGPFDLGDLLAAALGGLGQGLGLQTPASKAAVRC